MAAKVHWVCVVRRLLDGDAHTFCEDGILQELLSQLEAAADAFEAGRCAAAAHLCGPFVNSVRAQTNKKIEASAAAILASDALSLAGRC